MAYDTRGNHGGQFGGFRHRQCRDCQKLDTKTGKTTMYPTPTRGRRGHADAQGRIWFAGYFAAKFSMFDPKTKQIQENHRARIVRIEPLD